MSASRAIEKLKAMAANPYFSMDDDPMKILDEEGIKLGDVSMETVRNSGLFNDFEMKCLASFPDLTQINTNTMSFRILLGDIVTKYGLPSSCFFGSEKFLPIQPGLSDSESEKYPRDCNLMGVDEDMDIHCFTVENPTAYYNEKNTPVVSIQEIGKISTCIGNVLPLSEGKISSSTKEEVPKTFKMKNRKPPKARDPKTLKERVRKTTKVEIQKATKEKLHKSPKPKVLKTPKEKIPKTPKKKSTKETNFTDLNLDEYEFYMEEISNKSALERTPNSSQKNVNVSSPRVRASSSSPVSLSQQKTNSFSNRGSQHGGIDLVDLITNDDIDFNDDFLSTFSS